MEYFYCWIDTQVKDLLRGDKRQKKKKKDARNNPHGIMENSEVNLLLLEVKEKVKVVSEAAARS